MKAMIFAAGKGTRLFPLTQYTPKALVKFNKIPLLERLIVHLKKNGVSQIVINVHYLSDLIIDFLAANNNFGIDIFISNETDQLLDTGGGLKKASRFFSRDEVFILHNVDVVSNIDLDTMIACHKKQNALVTMAVRRRESSRYLLFNKQNELSGWRNKKTNQEIITKPDEQLSEFAFSGIHVINSEIFNYIEQDGSFSIIDTYLELSSTHKILAYNHTNDYWFDIGTVDKLKKAEQFLIGNNL